MSKHKLAIDNIQVPEGYKKTEVGVIPEDWETCMLGDAVEFMDGNRKPIKESERAKIRGIYPYYGASGIVDYVNDYLFDEDLILLGEDGENILSRSTRLAFRVSGKIWVNNHAHVLKPKPDFNIDFLAEYLESLDYSLHNSGTAQPKLNQQTCRRITVICPPLKEQRAIAQTLSDVDGLITALDKAIAKKRNIKTATMQELLTGKKRLPGFGEEWKTMVFSEIASCRKYRIDPRKSGTQEFCIELEHIESGTGRLLGNTQTGYQSSLKAVFKPRDVLFGKLRYLRKYWLADREGVCSTEIWVLVANSSLAISEFLYQIVTTEQFIDIASIAYGTHMPRSDWNLVKNYNVAVPPVKEQRAIATILSDMDGEIAALEKRRAKTQAMKQGMMQELLTGKTRLIDPNNPYN